MKRLAPLIFSLLIFTLSAETQTPSFVEVAKEGIPAVVSIQVKQDSRSGLGGEGENPFDFFDDPFFRHFFGKPRRGPEQNYQMGQASGFIVTPDGMILTNGHVVQDASEILVKLHDGREFKAVLVGTDPSTDIAVIKVDAKDLPTLRLGDSDALEVGQWVLAIGNPLGLKATVTKGIVSAKGRSNLDIARIEDFIQTDAAINRGNSGGPLITLDGKVIGINTAIVTNMGTGGYMGIGFAIPSNMAKEIMEQLVENGSVSRGFLGVALQQVDADLAQSFNLRKAEGALVAMVSKDSPAERAGIRQGDVIVKFNGKEVTSTGQLRNTVALMKPGTQVQIEVLREGKMVPLTLSIGTFEEEKKVVKQNENKLGVEVEALTPELARRLGVGEAKGVVISTVQPNSAAAWAGLKKGTLILQVNQKNVTTVEEFFRALETSETGKPVLLLVRQGEAVQYISIRLG